MAFENFVFADPQLNAVRIADIQAQAAVNQALAQQRAQSQALQRQERQAALQREENRAIREGDIRRAEATEAERRRQFDVTTGLTREIATGRAGDAAEIERYNNILAMLGAAERGSGDLPTERELEPLIVDLKPERQRAIRNERGRIFNFLLRNADLIEQEVNRLNPFLGTRDDKGVEYTPDRLLGLSQFKSNIRVGPAGRLESLFRRPRTDAPEPTARTAGVEPISELIGRTRPDAFPRAGVVEPLLQSLVRPFTGEPFRGPAVPEAAPSPGFFVPGRSLGGTAGRIAALPGQIGSYLRENVIPGIAEGLNRIEIGPDLRGYFPRESQQPIVYPALPLPPRAPRYVNPEDIEGLLAPPQFYAPVPGY